jgi:P pilus assembly chaperone PapD
MKLKLMSALGIFLFTGSQHSVQAALSVERSRVIFNEGEKSVGLSVKNNNTQDPISLRDGWKTRKKKNKRPTDDFTARTTH